MMPSVQAIRHLVTLMKARQRQRERPYALLLGSAITLTPDIISRITGQSERVQMYQALRGLSQNERFAVLSNAWGDQSTLPAYQQLAQILKLGYFDVVLTTDPTNNLEDALIKTGIAFTQFDTLILGRDSKISSRLDSRVPRIKIVKMRGDLNSRSLSNLLPEEALRLEEPIEMALRSLLDRDSIVVGLAPEDHDIERYIRISEGALWIVSPEEPNPSSFAYAALHARSAAQLITGSTVELKVFFTQLLTELENDQTSNVTQEAASIENELDISRLSVKSTPSSETSVASREKKQMQAAVFISYSHKDEKEKDHLLAHLGVLHSAGLIDLWSDDRIGAGADWEEEINQAIVQANVAILLVSANFLTSKFILGKEVPALLKRREHEGLTIFPVIAKACAWEVVDWLAKMNVRPKYGKPVWSDAGSHVDEDLAVIAREVSAILKRNSG